MGLTHRMRPEAALRYAVETSDESWLAFINGEFACVLGVKGPSILGGTAAPWFLASDVIERHRKLFLDRSHRVVEDLVREYGTLSNHVWDGHTKAKAWLSRIGFTLEDPEPYGISGAPFRRFWRS